MSAKAGTRGCLGRAGASRSQPAQTLSLRPRQLDLGLRWRSAHGAWARSAAWNDDAGHARALSLRQEDPKGIVALARPVNAVQNAPELEELWNIQLDRMMPDAKAVRLLRESVLNDSAEGFAEEPLARDLQRCAETLQSIALEHAVARRRLTARMIA